MPGSVWSGPLSRVIYSGNSVSILQGQSRMPCVARGPLKLVIEIDDELASAVARGDLLVVHVDDSGLASVQVLAQDKPIKKTKR